MLDYEAEYNNRARVPEHPAIFERWARNAAAFRTSHSHAELAIPYGPSPRQHIDLFWPSAERDAPIVLFIHGGYWRSLEPALFSHVAVSANANGLAMALAGYDLCPNVSISEIIAQTRNAAVFLGRRHNRQMLACGHSAGGHLASCLLATEWGKYAPGIPNDLITAAFSISGLFDLSPLVGISMNADLKLDANEARRVSSLYWDMPQTARTFDAWVGAKESSEFLRQSRAIADAWQGKDVATRYEEVADADHFTVVDPLTNPTSAMTRRLVELSRSIG